MANMKKTILAGAILAACSTASMAGDVNFSGFGTIGYSQTDSNTVVNRTDEKGSWGHNTRIGIQADTKISDKLSATAQIRLAEDAINDENMQMTLQTALLSYQASDKAQVRFGRLRAPFYLDSEFLDVGAVTTTDDNPFAIYGQVPFSNYNGVDMIYTTDVGDYELQVQPYIGFEQLEYKLPDGSGKKFDVNYVAGVNASMYAGDWQVRAGYTVGEMDDPSYTENPMTDKYNVNNDQGTFATIGVKYDNGKLLAKAEYAKRNVDGAISIPDLTGYYATLGYAFGNVMPYVSYQSLDSASKNHDPMLMNMAFFDMDGTTAGVRYTHDDLVFKAQVTNYNFGSLNGSYASPVNGMSATTDSAQLISASVSTTF